MDFLTNTSAATALVTGASSGIGAVYARRLARRGHNLVLVARDARRLEALAAEFSASDGVQVEVLPADLADAAGRARVEARLAAEPAISLLVNNAGLAAHTTYANPDPSELQRLIAVNVLAVTTLTAAAIPGMLARGAGAIINIASTLSVVPEFPLGVYNATKAFVLSLSQGLAAEIGGRGLYVQAVLPAATRTEIWQRSGRDLSALNSVMDVEEMVDAALVGFDRRESVTIPSLPDVSQWAAFEGARQAMARNFSQAHAAERYRV
jgi:uncharacterized protein